MIAERWAEELARTVPSRPILRRAVALHVADTITAFFAGCGTRDAQALARFYPPVDDVQRVAAAAAITRHTECDDIDVVSCITPGAIAVPAALGAMSYAQPSRERFESAVAAGYAVGLRLGSAIGGPAALTHGIWPTYFAAPMIAAASFSVCLGLDAYRIASAITLAAAGSGGRAGRMQGRWFALGEAVLKGCRAALAAADGFRGDHGLISVDWLRAAASPTHVMPDALLAGTLEEAVPSVGLKPFVGARQTTNAVIAFQTILGRGIDSRAVERVIIGVPTINATMVSRPPVSGDRLSTISSMQFQIAASALQVDLLYDVERMGQPATELLEFGRRVVTEADPALDANLPTTWAGRVRVFANGHEFEETCLKAPGDAGGNNLEAVVLDKIRRMIPARLSDLCLGAVSDPDNVQLAYLWEAIVEALANPTTGTP